MSEGYCRECGQWHKELSVRGLCPECGLRLLEESGQSMAQKKGRAYEQWRKSMREAIEKEEER